MDKFVLKVRSGAEEVRRVGEQLSKIIVQVQQMSPNFESVSKGIHTQSSLASSIEETIAQLRETAFFSVEAIRSSSQALQELNEIAQSMQDEVSQFKV